jgi:hypothetical protein
MPQYHGKEQHASSEGLKVNIFTPYTAEQIGAIRIGTPAYQMIHPYNKAMSSPTKDAHYKSLVRPSMSKANKSMASHLGIPSTFIGSKFNGLV